MLAPTSSSSRISPSVMVARPTSTCTVIGTWRSTPNSTPLRALVEGFAGAATSSAACSGGGARLLGSLIRNSYLLDQEASPSSMLDDGPRKQHLVTAVKLQGWNSTLERAQRKNRAGT